MRWRWRSPFAGSPKKPQAAERARLDAAITALGIALDEHPFRPGQDGTTAAMRRDLLDALDAYDRAKRRAADDDPRGAREAVEDGRHALAVLDARLAGQRPPDRMPECFFDPVHGRATARVRWAPEGGRERLVAVCATDAARLAEISGPRASGKDEAYGDERRRPVTLPDARGPYVLRVVTASPARFIVSRDPGRGGQTYRVHGGGGPADALLPLPAGRGGTQVWVEAAADDGAAGTDWAATAHTLDEVAAHDPMTLGHGDGLVRHDGPAGPAVFAHRGPGRFELLALNGRLVRWATAASGTGDQDVSFSLPGPGWYQVRARGSWTLTMADG
ncbi:hypothetical protein [Streptomyces sp. NPDC005970]|uniref:hypothetical protein n=1 Tax=Streptomyces sp. NPDC005970 TaxID=3156723 RepID=UPI0033FB3892